MRYTFHLLNYMYLLTISVPANISQAEQSLRDKKYFDSARQKN